MLRPPYQSYDRLYVYHLDKAEISTIDDPDLIGIWIEDETAVLFFHRAKDSLVAELCSRHECKVVYQADLDYCDWEAGQFISSFTVGGITVSPVWEKGPADIRLDPSVIFGSGFHPTTRACLETVITYLQSPEAAIKTMLDLGTGTGLLSIAAARFGAEKITAVDNNPLACEVARANCRLNGVDDRIEVTERDLRKDKPQTNGYNLVVANLYRGLLEQLIQTPSFWEGDIYILSGFIQSMEADLLAELPARQIRFLDRKQNDRWCIWVLGNRKVVG
ncbi:MAG: 50S ribosomal protein L11 methyltransferase [Proteobacteria bacterium]|nr:50S ribosomal protein L11 methyltransferase [Pseudomonadota bacterium]MBU4296487.1 50S ribosomal protein L11 methyltransferase [Pseudomonadota bacterium]MCG2749669.1 50S ribosomal protein L11 methyltransferase [Desulfobulbaceae bacterium]